MHLVQILLPVRDNAGNAFPNTHYQRVREAVTEKYDGLTAYTRAPAEGVWHGEKDDIVIVEVMVDALDKEWWRAYRTSLEILFQQDEIVVRAQELERL